MRTTVSWNELKVGDILEFSWDEFDGHSSLDCEVTRICEDHAIAKEITDYGRPMVLVIDEDTQGMFLMGNEVENTLNHVDKALQALTEQTVKFVRDSLVIDTFEDILPCCTYNKLELDGKVYRTKLVIDKY